VRLGLDVGAGTMSEISKDMFLAVDLLLSFPLSPILSSTEEQTYTDNSDLSVRRIAYADPGGTLELHSNVKTPSLLYATLSVSLLWPFGGTTGRSTAKNTEQPKKRGATAT